MKRQDSRGRLRFSAIEDKSSSVHREKPLLVAIVLCTSIEIQHPSGNKNLIGLFNTINTLYLPCFQPEMFILGAFTGVQGVYEIVMEITTPDGNVFRFGGSMVFEDPYVVVDFVFHLKNFPLMSEGVYEVNFTSYGERIGYRHVLVQKGSPVLPQMQ